LFEEKKVFEKKKKELNQTIDEKVNKELFTKEKIMKNSLIKQIKSENDFILKQKNLELEEKSKMLKNYHMLKAQNEKIKRELSESVYAADAKLQIELSNQVNVIKHKIQKEFDQRIELDKIEWIKKIEDQKKLTLEMTRKLDQGSTQVQGEVLEIAVENHLRNLFHFDEISEIKKGVNGADVIQIVNNHEAKNCGTIYYEIKRTKTFQNSWIEKFRKDIKNKNADLGVLVSETLPKGFSNMGIINGIYVCTFNEFKGLCTILRQSLIDFNRIKVSNKNKKHKMSMLYDFLSGNEFKIMLENIVEGFKDMDSDLETEKRMMFKSWKKREKQIEKIVSNTIDLYASIKGIGGNSILSIDNLKFDNIYNNKLSIDKSNSELGFNAINKRNNFEKPNK